MKFLRTVLVILGLATIVTACEQQPENNTKQNDLMQMPAHFSAGHEVFRGSFSPDGDRFYFFRKKTPGEEDYRIHYSDKIGDNWSTPTQLNLDGEHNDLYPDLSSDGKQMIFASYRPYPEGDPEAPETNLWMVDMANGAWGSPYPLLSLNDPARHQSGPRFGPKGSIYFEQYSADWRTVTTYMAVPDGTGGYTITEDPTIEYFRERLSSSFHVWSGRLSHDGRLFFISVAEKNEEGRAKLETTGYWVSVKEGDGWSEPVPLVGGVNSPDKTDNFLTLSHDGKTLSFVRAFSEFWTISLEHALPPSIAQAYYDSE